MAFSNNPFDHTGTLDTTGYGLKSVTSDLPNSQTITAVTNSGKVVTATVGSTANLFVGDVVTIAGITGFTTNNPNGTYAVNSVPGSTTFTYVAALAPTGAYSSGGTVHGGADQGNTSVAFVCPAFDDATLAADAANRTLPSQPLSPYAPLN